MSKSNVGYKHLGYAGALESWTTMADVLDSPQRIRDKGTRYLPQLDGQTDTQYTAYKARGNFPLFTKHVLTTFVGMALRKDLMVSNIPEAFVKNVDGAGTSLTAYTKELLEEFLSFGRCLTLTEYGGARAKLILYGHLSIINWRTKVVDDVEQLSLVVLEEGVPNPNAADEFATDLVSQYRVLSLDDKTNNYRQRVYDKDFNLKSNVVPTKNREPLKFIPAVIHGGVNVKQPPLLSIAEENLSWYRIDCDYKHGLHYTALPTPWVSGVDPDDKNAPKAIGPTEIWFLPDGASTGMLEFSGAGLETVAKAKAETGENIITLSSRILSPSTNTSETATAASIRNAGETASLADTVNMLSREVTLSIEYALNWDNVVTDIDAAINTDFIPTILSGGDAASYGAMNNKGTLSAESLFKVLKQGEVHEGDRTFEEEQEAIKRQRKEDDDREVEKAGRIAEAEAKATAKYAVKEEPDTGTQGDSEEGETNGEEADLQGKDKEQVNDKPNKKDN